jgi:glycosyltransferase involved in cell wall biosynthesis/GT2 family glycosyltransferase/SAM-dependent methyltransferase
MSFSFIETPNEATMTEPLPLKNQPPRPDQADALAGSPFFDPDWYLDRYPDVAAAGVSPSVHYLFHGASEGRDPGPRFSTRAYMDLNPDVATTGMNPLLHFIVFGFFEGRPYRPSDVADASQNAPALAPDSEEIQIISGSGLLDADWYRRVYADVAIAGVNPATHYFHHGAAEGRDPGPRFSTRTYLNLNPDVAAAGVNPLLHYVLHGASEGRLLQPVTSNVVRPPQDLSRILSESEVISASPLFNAGWYVDRYPEVAGTTLEPAVHYASLGAWEGKDPGPWFSSATYLDLHPDVGAARVNPLFHFLMYGVFEGRALRPEEPPPPSASGSKPKIVYISGEPDTPGNHYRVLRYGAAAEASGRAQVTWMRSDEVEGRLRELETADMLIIWRALWTPAIAAAIGIARGRGKPVIFDCDDLMTEPDLANLKTIDGIRSQNLTEDGTRAHYETVRKTMLASDIGFAPTEELAFYLRGAQKPTFVLPNGFDDLTLANARRAARLKRKARPDSLIRIGYAGGSRTHQRDVGIAIEGLAKVLRERPQCRFVLFRTTDNSANLIDIEEYPSFAGLADQIEWRHLQPLHDLPNELARFDINLAPLEFGNPFCEAKSELKFFEAALVDVPTVASPTGPFRRAIEHGKTGFLAATANDWYTYLLRLVDDAELRKRIGREAYHAALGAFGPLQRTEAMGRVVAQLGKGQDGAHAWALDASLKSLPKCRPAVFPSQVVFEHDTLKASAITVVIPLYNYEQYITEALQSAYNQTLKDIDLVIVDGFSTDQSLAVAHRWAIENYERFNRLVLIKNEQNYGLGLCRNSGFDAAETPYVLLLDADNRLLPECCENLLRTIGKGSYAFAYGSIQQFGRLNGKLSDSPYEPQRFVAGNFIDAMALVSKEAWSMVGGCNHVRYGWEDYDFWCRLAECGLRGVHDLRTIAEYRTHGVSMLQTQTTVPENYRKLWADFGRRHPWVTLGEEFSSRHPRQAIGALSQPHEMERLFQLLPILRCPETRQKFTISPDRTQLVTVDGRRTWSLHQNRPVLAPGAGTPEVRPFDHVSNQLSGKAEEIIQQAGGLVLNLSAGGTSHRPDNVVEVEYAIFRNTDVVADAHALPFDDETFAAVISFNAFEHYRDPRLVAQELRRVLKPGGRIHIMTAFMQPLHERPWHFYNATRYGVAEWFSAFEEEELGVSPNFCPNHTIAWITSEMEAALRHHVSPEAADYFLSASVRDIVAMWRDEKLRSDQLWRNFEKLPQEVQDIAAAGYEFIGRRPLEVHLI